MKTIWFVISLCLLFYGIHAAHQLYEGDICDRDGSKCQHVKNCPNIKKQIQSNKRPTLCGFNGTDVVVCCQPDIPWNSDEYYKSISHSICHVYEEELCKNKSIGSSNTLKNLESKLPFMAMVGYGTRSSITWNCGGTLISREYVLSAAHCTNHKLLGSAGWVRLKNEDPNDRESTYRIVFKINHPDYQPPMQYNDVALYRLNRIVRFGELVKPLCLPNLDYMDYTRDFNVIGAGWIRNKGSVRAASGLLSVVPSGRCSFVGNKHEIPDGTNKESIICTTLLSGGNNDCSNHFGGGSLFISDNTEKQTKSCYMGVLMGVLSIGRLCDGHNFPGAYTNVSYFLPWINSVVWPENSTHTQLIWA